MTFLLLLVACDPVECVDESGGARAVGESWACEDGCNTCACEESGQMSRTEEACAESCVDSTGEYTEGDSWECPDGCNTCTCEPGGTISQTDLGCV